MKLLEHPGFVDGWDEGLGSASDWSYLSPMDRRDILSEVILQSVGSDSPSVVLRTMYRGKQSTRDKRVRDDKFAKALTDFLKTQIGKTIEEIGENEVDF